MPALEETENPPFEHDHDIVDGERLVDALAGAVAAVADGDRAAITLVDHIPGKDVAILSGRALEPRIGDGKFANNHHGPFMLHELRAAAETDSQAAHLVQPRQRANDISGGWVARRGGAP